MGENEMRDSRGNVIDDAYIEAATSDLDTAEIVRVKRVGRPPLGEVSRESPHLSFRVPEQLAGELREAAAELETSVSTVARVAIAEYLERHRKK